MRSIVLRSFGGSAMGHLCCWRGPMLPNAPAPRQGAVEKRAAAVESWGELFPAQDLVDQDAGEPARAEVRLELPAVVDRRHPLGERHRPVAGVGEIALEE